MSQIRPHHNGRACRGRDRRRPHRRSPGCEQPEAVRRSISRYPPHLRRLEQQRPGLLRLGERRWRSLQRRSCPGNRRPDQLETLPVDVSNNRHTRRGVWRRNPGMPPPSVPMSIGVSRPSNSRVLGSAMSQDRTSFCWTLAQRDCMSGERSLPRLSETPAGRPAAARCVVRFPQRCRPCW